MISGFCFYKIKIDFEYMNEIYTVIAEPYHTLLELKEKTIKKIFPKPKNIHCFYKNLDIYEKEDEQISRLFPFKKKLKIKLKMPSKEKRPINSYKSYNLYSYKYLEKNAKSNIIENKEVQIPKIEVKSDSSIKCGAKIKIKMKNNRNLNNKNFVKKRLLSFTSMLENQKTRKKSNDLFEAIEDEYKDDELFYWLNKNKIKKFKSLDNIKNYNNDNNNDKNNNKENNKQYNEMNELEEDSISKTERKPKRLSKIKINFNDIKINNIKTQREKEDDIKEKLEIKFEKEKEEKNEDSLVNAQDKNEIKVINNKIKNNEKNENEINQNEDQIKNIEDENYNCSLCRKSLINNYCIKCNKFICKNCLEKCKLENHENIEIKINDDCLSNINLYGSSIISSIDKKVKEIQEYDKELKIYDIKKNRDNLISMFNEIINIYSQITQALKNMYKEKDVKDEMSKYRIDSDKIKDEINEIIKKAESYVKSDKNNNSPKFKIMNMQYFFGLINEKQNSHKLLTEKMNVYSLNTNLNYNIENSFKSIEEIMKKISNKENPFDLKENMKDEYDKLLKEQKNISNVKDKKKMFFRRRSMFKAQIPNFPTILPPDENGDKCDNK